jgi:hypothetical protein
MSELVNQNTPSVNPVPPTPAEVNPCFYFAAFTDEEKRLYEQARKADALDDEIILLRVKIFALISREPNNMSMLIRSLACLNQLSRTNVKVFKRDAVDLQKIKESTIAMIKETGLPLEYVESRFRQDSLEAR